ncbi:MAG: hypothetical protein F7C38_06210 [Desulfurococcales archaeon]|nr:hypothetical protein [Desulfurococcales archaeon]
MMLVVLLIAGIVSGYLLSTLGYRDLAGRAEKAMSVTVYGIVLLVGLEAGRLVTSMGFLLPRLAIETLVYLMLPAAASLLAATILWKAGLLCK